ncbi:MAG TPA: aroma-sacti cluster domain-containing protein [Streptosporangiaceae bacterium]
MSDTNDAADPLERLRAAGFDLGMFDPQQLELLGALSDGELTVLLDIRERIGEVRMDADTNADAEVEAHDAGMAIPMTIGGLLF